MFDEFFTEAASRLGILRLGQEHRGRWGTDSPAYIVGGPANDVITFTFTPGVTAFLTLQTECGAKATISG